MYYLPVPRKSFYYDIFTTLSNNWLAYDAFKGENRVSSSIVTLSRLLKIGVETNSTIIPLSEEIQNTKLYTQILEIRYKDKFDIHWEINKQTLELCAIKLSLQPLIENAVYHGIRNKPEKGVIRISSFIEDSNLIILVEDTGIGMSENEVKKINDIMKSENFNEVSHIGLKNVNQRIKLLFGDNYGLELISEYNIGTTVKITLPYCVYER